MDEKNKFFVSRTGVSGIAPCANEVEYIFNGRNFGYLCIALGSLVNAVILILRHKLVVLSINL